MSDTRVLVIDDSALMRKHLRSILEGSGYQVETARNGQEGLEKLQSFDPTVVTLDINMPVMDGLTCLSHIMSDKPTPVVMVSSLTEKGALATFEALELGAINYVAKPGGTVSLNIKQVSEELLQKVSEAARTRVKNGSGLRSRLRAQREAVEVQSQVTRRRPKESVSAVLIGVSTGGPGTLELIINNLPADFPAPIVIAQHMPERFTQVFAERLNRSAALTVSEVNRPTVISSGNVYIARGDSDLKFIRRSGKTLVTSVPATDKYIWHPSVECMVETAREFYDPRSLVTVQLTGMGNDGADAMAELKNAGARTIAESEETAVVYGMPRELIDQGGAVKVLPNYAIADQLMDWVMGPAKGVRYGT